MKATISSTSSYISELLPATSVSYNSGSGTGDIYPNSEKFGKAGSAPNYYDYTVKFIIAEGTPSGTDISFNMHITDGEGNEWEDSFNVQVSATGALLNYSKHTVVYDDNHDGMINQNETVYLKVYIKNNGSSKANDVKATISSASSYISDLSPTTEVTYNSGVGAADIYPNGEDFGYYGNAPDYNYYTVSFKVAVNAPAGTDITLNMDITDEAENEWSDSFTVTVE